MHIKVERLKENYVYDAGKSYSAVENRTQSGVFAFWYLCLSTLIYPSGETMVITNRIIALARLIISKLN